jgi:hypothetical protein
VPLVVFGKVKVDSGLRLCGTLSCVSEHWPEVAVLQFGIVEYRVETG